MRCLACNTVMTDYEASLRSNSGAYVDLCRRCYATVEKDLPAVGNPSLLHEYDTEEGTDEGSLLDDNEE